MVMLNSFFHREKLCHIIERWLVGKLKPHDAYDVKRIINFNTLVLSPILQQLTEEMAQHFYGDEIRKLKAGKKGILKDFLVAHPWHRTTRIEEMISRYRRVPENYYRETPFQGTIYYRKEKTLRRPLAISRTKRIRRIGEKCSRRIIDDIYGRIKHQAEDLAKLRARKLGIDIKQLITPKKQMEEEFKTAEDKIRENINMGRVIFDNSDYIINDIAGIKIIGENNFAKKVNSYLKTRATVVEFEGHRGGYNATNIIVSWPVDKKQILKILSLPGVREECASRGMSVKNLRKDIDEFVNGCEPGINIEIIVTSFAELLESEIGRCMHEDRTMNLRKKMEYTGPLSTNVEYIMIFLFTFCLSSRREIAYLPFNLWTRYMSDYFTKVIYNLYRGTAA